MNAPILKTAARPPDRVAEIAAAARALIAERGFEGLRTRDIAAKVGINIATPHYHVPTKERLIELVAQSLRDDFIAQDLARPREGLSALDLIRLEFSDFRENLIHRPDIFAVMTELRERARRDPNIAAMIGPMQQYWRSVIADILKKGQRDGSFRADMDPHAAATIVISSLVGAYRLRSDIEQFDHVTAELERALRAPIAISSENTPT